ncbi:MAG: hypothetical protein A2452_00940 [Candidatus Firestonebacteria bacterium RIFOXYC2_FULL_39_67]|nr:MAG: hypothetical protein A2536_10900 [Candidatus Firestonebacteria bacterium RIFOXYD2_FULL_39_29]OGF54766.1 MAG: hypothetical protein A2452_00940 [Candidatus Firestonebacteria bacterium RIFOXYC2_FULL_39_67]
MKRYTETDIVKDLKKKMVFITGPRQVGKTYIAKQLAESFEEPLYLNYDDINDAKTILNRTWSLKTDLVIFDEIHKQKDWKNYLKGVFDTRSGKQTFLVTGSARLETFKKAGDSLAGRYFGYRLNPLSVKELSAGRDPFETLETLNRLGGFPEPFLSGSLDYANKWRAQYFSNIIREDILEFGKVTELRAMKLLLELLRKRVGSPISYSGLAVDMQVSPVTVKKYLQVLEDLFIIIVVHPFHQNIARSILKEPKVYFYDTGYVDGDEGIKLENTVAVSLLKHVQYLQDTKGSDISLKYVKTKEGKETDFAIAESGSLTELIEVKLSDRSLAPGLRYFAEHFKKAKAVQLVHNLDKTSEPDGILVTPAGKWLAGLSA